MKKDKREAKRERVVSAARRLSEHKSAGDYTAIRAPAGLPKFVEKEDKTYRLSIIPWDVGKGNPFAKPGDLYYERTYFTHRSVGPGNDTVICGAKTFKKRCPVCEVRMNMKVDPNDKAAKEAAAKLNPKERQIWLVYDHDDPTKGVQFWEISNFAFGKSLDAKIQRARPEEKNKILQFADPKRGYILHVGTTKEAAGAGSYVDCSDIEFRPRKEPLLPEVVNHGLCPDDWVPIPDYKEVLALFDPNAAEEKDDESEDEEGSVEGTEEEDDDTADGGDESDDDTDDDGGSDEDEDEEGDEEEEEVIAKGDDVTFLRKGKRVAGTVLAVKGEKAKVKVKGLPEPLVVSLASLKLAEPPTDDEDDEFETFDEDEDDTPPPPKKKLKPAKPRSRKKPKDDDDTDPC